MSVIAAQISADKLHLWKSGPEHFHFALPEPKGDGWEILFKHLYDQDQSQCDTWREEVNNLLIFVSFFNFNLCAVDPHFDEFMPVATQAGLLSTVRY